MESRVHLAIEGGGGDVAARLHSDDHSRLERGGLGDRGSVVDVHSKVVRHVVRTKRGCAGADIFFVLRSDETYFKKVLTEEHLEVKLDFNYVFRKIRKALITVILRTHQHFPIQPVDGCGSRLY